MRAPSAPHQPQPQQPPRRLSSALRSVRSRACSKETRRGLSHTRSQRIGGMTSFAKSRFSAAKKEGASLVAAASRPLPKADRAPDTREGRDPRHQARVAAVALPLASSPAGCGRQEGQLGST